MSSGYFSSGSERAHLLHHPYNSGYLMFSHFFALMHSYQMAGILFNLSIEWLGGVMDSIKDFGWAKFPQSNPFKTFSPSFLLPNFIVWFISSSEVGHSLLPVCGWSSMANSLSIWGYLGFVILCLVSSLCLSLIFGLPFPRVFKNRSLPLIFLL